MQRAADLPRTRGGVRGAGRDPVCPHRHARDPGSGFRAAL